MKAYMKISKFKALVEDLNTYFYNLDTNKLYLADLPVLETMMQIEIEARHARDYKISEEMQQKIEELLARAERKE